MTRDGGTGVLRGVLGSVRGWNAVQRDARATGNRRVLLGQFTRRRLVQPTSHLDVLRLLPHHDGRHGAHSFENAVTYECKM